LEVLSTPRIAAKAIDAARLDAKPARLAKPKIETKHEELSRPVEPKAAERREEMSKTATPKAVDKVVFQLVDGPASMKLTYVMKEGKKMPTVNAVAQFSALEEEFRRRLRLSGVNASVVGRGGFEVAAPKDELEKLTPEESRKAVPRTRGADRRRGEKKGGGGVRRFDFGAKAINIGGVRLGLVFKADRPPRAEKYGDPQLIAEIKTALENKLREMLGYEFEQWKNYIKVKEGGRRLVITRQLLERLAQNPNTAKTLDEKT
jgi:hypothetical protein